MLALWGMIYSDKPQDGLEAPVVDVPFGVEVPTLDRGHHFCQDIIPGWFSNGPSLWTVTRHVSQNSRGVVTDLINIGRKEEEVVSRVGLVKNNSGGRPRSVSGRF